MEVYNILFISCIPLSLAGLIAGSLSRKLLDMKFWKSALILFSPAALVYIAGLVVWLKS